MPKTHSPQPSPTSASGTNTERGCNGTAMTTPAPMLNEILESRLTMYMAFSTSAVLATGFGYVGNWANVSDGYLGVRFLINGEVHYGWIGFRNVTANRTVVVRLAGWAYETQPDKAILAGDIGTSADVGSFQPTSLEILASGHTAIDQRRKRTTTAGETQ